MPTQVLIANGPECQVAIATGAKIEFTNLNGSGVSRFISFSQEILGKGARPPTRGCPSQGSTPALARASPGANKQCARGPGGSFLGGRDFAQLALFQEVDGVPMCLDVNGHCLVIAG